MRAKRTPMPSPRGCTCGAPLVHCASVASRSSPMPTAPVKSAVELLGVPPPPRNGRERIVAAAVKLFYRRGFGAVGLDQVIAAAGVAKTTFYKHFDSKDDLVIAAIQRRDE